MAFSIPWDSSLALRMTVKNVQNDNKNKNAQNDILGIIVINN